MRYFVRHDIITTLVLTNKTMLRDFLDFGTKTVVSGGITAYGWIETDKPLQDSVIARCGLVAV